MLHKPLDNKTNILAYNNLTLCAADYFETCWCKLNAKEPSTCSYLLRYVASSSNSSHFCVYHTIRKGIECFNSSLVLAKSDSVSNLYLYVTILLFVIGILGNGLAIIVLFDKTLRCLSVYRNLIIYCALNILYLLAISSRHVNGFELDLRDISPSVCRWHTFVVAFTGHLCSWQLVSTSIQRVHALLSLQLNRTASWIQTLAILGLCVVLPLFLFDAQIVLNYGLLSKRHMCDESSTFKIKQFQRALDSPIDSQSKLLRNITTRYHANFFRTQPLKPHVCGICILWNVLDTFIYAVIPFVIVLISSVIIIVKICERRRSVSIVGGICHTSQRLVSSQEKLSILLILINCLFLVMTGPFNIYLIVQSTVKYFFSKSFPLKVTMHLNDCLRLLQNSYHALSFVFYCLIGNKFRKSAWSIARRIYCRLLCGHELAQSAFMSCCYEHRNSTSTGLTTSTSVVGYQKRISNTSPMKLMQKNSYIARIARRQRNKELDVLL